jgi:hypothetical protein
MSPDVYAHHVPTKTYLLNKYHPQTFHTIDVYLKFMLYLKLLLYIDQFL